MEDNPFDGFVDKYPEVGDPSYWDAPKEKSAIDRLYMDGIVEASAGWQLVASMLAYPDLVPEFEDFLDRTGAYPSEGGTWIEALRAVGSECSVSFASLRKELKKSGEEHITAKILAISDFLKGPATFEICLRDCAIEHMERLKGTPVLPGNAAETLSRIARIEDWLNGSDEEHPADEFLANIDKEWEEPDQSFGLRDLDMILDGLRPGRLIVVGAKPGEGKSSLALGAAMHSAEKAPVFVASLEMSRSQCFERMVCMSAQVTTDRREWTQGCRDAVRDHAIRLKSLPVYLSDFPGINVEGVVREARRAITERGARMVVVDYLQLLRSESSGRLANLPQIIGDAAQQLKNLSLDMDVPVLVPAQIRRDVVGKPAMTDLSDSSGIEKAADQIAMIHFDGGLTSLRDREPAGEIIIQKNRHGATGNVEALFKRMCAKWIDKAYEGNQWDGEI